MDELSELLLKYQDQAEHNRKARDKVESVRKAIDTLTQDMPDATEANSIRLGVGLPRLKTIEDTVPLIIATTILRTIVKGGTVKDALGVVELVNPNIESDMKKQHSTLFMSQMLSTSELLEFLSVYSKHCGIRFTTKMLPYPRTPLSLVKKVYKLRSRMESDTHKDTMIQQQSVQIEHLQRQVEYLEGLSNINATSVTSILLECHDMEPRDKCVFILSKHQDISLKNLALLSGVSYRTILRWKDRGDLSLPK